MKYLNKYIFFLIAVIYLYFTNLFNWVAIINTYIRLDNNGKKEHLKGENQIEYKNIFWKRFHTARGNFFWKFVDWLSFKNKKLAKIYDMTIGNEYRKERKKFNLSYAKRVLHIGCGSYPITALVIAEMKDVNIVTIDEDEQAIKRAKKILDKKNLNGKIKAVIGNGTEYPLDDFDTIIISGCAIPKEEVFKRVLKDADSNSNIILRSSFISVESIINSLNPKQDISIKSKIKNHLFPNSEWKSYFIIKK